MTLQEIQKENEKEFGEDIETMPLSLTAKEQKEYLVSCINNKQLRLISAFKEMVEDPNLSFIKWEDKEYVNKHDLLSSLTEDTKL